MPFTTTDLKVMDIIGWTLAPTGPVVTERLAVDTGRSSTDNITSNDTLTGTGLASAVVTFKEGTVTLGTAVANASGAWSFTPVLADGTHTVVASETDSTGSTGTASLTFTLDTTAPAAPVLTGDSVLATNQVTLTGTAEASSFVNVFDGTACSGRRHPRFHRQRDGPRRQCQRGLQCHRPGHFVGTGRADHRIVLSRHQHSRRWDHLRQCSDARRQRTIRHDRVGIRRHDAAWQGGGRHRQFLELRHPNSIRWTPCFYCNGYQRIRRHQYRLRRPGRDCRHVSAGASIHQHGDKLEGRHDSQRHFGGRKHGVDL